MHAHAIDPSLAGVITAIVGGIVGIGGLFLTVVGKREQNRQQAAADQAARDKRDLDQAAQDMAAVRVRAELAEAGERNLREENRRIREENNALEEQVDQQREEHRRVLARQEQRCRTQLDSITDSFITLQRVVNDEIAHAAARVALNRVLPHPHEPPPDHETGDAEL